MHTIMLINNAVAKSEVKVPRDVADALDKEFASATEEQKQWGLFNIIHLNSIYLSPSAKIIKRHFHPDKYLTLATALIHGYTVEETPQERIKRGVQEIYDEWTTIPSSGNDHKDGADLAERITKFVIAELKL